MSDQYPYNKAFRLKIAALTLDPHWVNKIGKIIKPEFFDTDEEQIAVQAILDYREKFGRIPADPENIIAMTIDDPGVEGTILDIFDTADDFYDMEYPKEVAIQWAKEQAVKIAILESIDDVNKGNLKDTVERMIQAVKVGEDLPSPGLDVVKDIDKWLYDLWIDKVPTGFVHMDIDLEGGLGIGELGVVLAPTNRGKSVALANIAVGAAGIGAGKNVLIATHEMKAELYAKRIAARIMFRFPDRHGDLRQYGSDFTELAAKLLPGAIRVIGGPQTMSVYDLKDNIEVLLEEGFKPDLIIDDYADLLEPPRSYKERRMELTATYKWLRSYAAELKCPVWTASQVGRAAYTKQVITTADIAEDIGKANTADVMFAICQTDDEEKAEMCRLFMPKVRDAKHGKMYDAKYYTDAQAIVTVGRTKQISSEEL